MESANHGRVQPQPAAAPDSSSGRGPRGALGRLAVAIGAFAFGWLYSTFVGCHGT